MMAFRGLCMLTSRQLLVRTVLPIAGGVYVHRSLNTSPVKDNRLGWLGSRLMNTAASEEAAQASSAAKVTLYQYQPCPFCNKVRAYLDYSKITYETIEVDPLFKKEIKFSTDYRKVPICFVEGQGQLNGSDDIIDGLRSLPGAIQPFETTAGSDQAALESKWRSWVNDKLVHLLTANIYNTWTESIGTFDYLVEHGNFSVGQRLLSSYTGAVVMFALSKRVWNKKYSIENPREEIYSALNDWVEAIGDNKFLGQSDAPTLADLAIFGVLRAIHEYPTFDDIMKNTKIHLWYFRMVDVVGDTSQI